MEKHNNLYEAYTESIAVVGMAGQFRDAGTCTELWENLKNGHEALHRLTKQELNESHCPPEHMDHPDFVPVTGQLNTVDLFDANFFGFTPAEAKEMDPQFRLLLETSWHAFEDAGYAPGDDPSELTGVFGGASPSFYLWMNAQANLHTYKSMAFNHTFMLNAHDFVSTWLSYKLGLRGPSVALQTACSTGLVSVAVACQNLLDYSCDTALAVAASLFSPRSWGYWAEQGGILSPEGHCRPFDSKASGTIMGEGVCALILKRFEDALNDGDRIHGIIRGCAINNDGPDKAGFTAPSITGQANVIRSALDAAQVDAADVTYIETHGTGTHLGDPIEFEALSSIYGDRNTQCIIGSLKANLGHLGSAAGMASLIKVLLMLKHDTIPPQINFQEPNESIPLKSSNFRITTNLEPWPENRQRLAGISSFGFGGTNCHIIVEGCPEWAKSQKAPGNKIPTASMTMSPDAELGESHCLMLSAPDQQALERQTNELIKYLENKNPKLGDTAWTLCCRRKHFSWRSAIVAVSVEDACMKLRDQNLVSTEVHDCQLYLYFPAASADIRAEVKLLKQALTTWPFLATNANSNLDELNIEVGGLQSETLTDSTIAEKLHSALINVFTTLAGHYGLTPEVKNAQNLQASQAIVFSVQSLEKEVRIEINTTAPGGIKQQWNEILGKLYKAGIVPAIPRNKANLADLPLYAFDPQSHWLNPPLPNSSISEEACMEEISLDEKLLLIWREAFGITTITAEDDFFTLGGTSMIAVAIIASIQTTTGLKISMPDFMSNRTVSNLVSYLSSQAKNKEIAYV